MNLTSKNIIITGAANGLGKALLERFVQKAGITIAIDRDIKGLKDLKKKYGKKIRTEECNLVKSGELKTLIKKLINTDIKYDLLINCAGRGSHKKLYQYNHYEIDTLILLNCAAPFVLTSSLLSAKSLNLGAKVVNIGSISGEVLLPSLSLYSASKAFLHAFTRSAQLEEKQININFLLVILGSLSDTKFGENITVKHGINMENYISFRKSASEAADKIIQAIEKDRRILIFPDYLKLIILIERFFPRFTFFIKSFIFHKYY